jgi:transglutaminase-like putative cysteine protease
MKSARNQFILVGFLCQGLAWDSWLYWLVAIALWALVLGPLRNKIKGGQNLELGGLICGSAISVVLGKLLGQSSHFFLGDGFVFLQVARMFRPLSRREKFASVLIGCFHLAVACTLAPNISFLLLALAALILFPKSLVELQSEDFNTSDSRLDWTLLVPLTLTALAVFIAVPRFSFGGPLQLGAAGGGSELLSSVLDPSSGGYANSPQVLLQVQGKNLRYFKCLALSQFDGKQWRVDGEHVGLRPFQRRLSEADLTSFPNRRVRVKNVNFLGRVLPTDGAPVTIHGKFFQKPLMNTQGAIECVSIWNSANNYYEYWIDPNPEPEQLSPQLIRYHTEHPIPSERLTRWITQVTAGATNQLDTARHIESYLRRNFKYRLGAPALNRLDSLDDFILDKQEGHCERFASALALLLRMHNIPTRIAIGYVPGPSTRFSDWRQIRFKDAHAWTEAWFPDIGWTAFDATPGGGGDDATWGLTEFLETLDIVWYSHVISFDRASQRDLLTNFMGAMTSIPRIVSRNITIFFVILALGFIPWLYRRTRLPFAVAKSKRGQIPTADHFYARLLRILDKRGFPRAPEQTPAEFLNLLRAKNIPCLDEIAQITQTFCDSRYGEQPLPPEEIERLATLLARIENEPNFHR